MNILTIVNDRIYSVIKVIMMVLLSIMSTMVFAAVIFRFAKISLPWVEEFSIYAFSWLTYFGSSVVLRNKGHLSVTAFTGTLKNVKVKRGFAILSQVIVLIFVMTMAYISAQMVMLFLQMDSRSINITSVKMGWIFAAIPVNYIVYVLFTVERIIGIAAGKEDE